MQLTCVYNQSPVYKQQQTANSYCIHEPSFKISACWLQHLSEYKHFDVMQDTLAADEDWTITSTWSNLNHLTILDTSDGKLAAHAQLIQTSFLLAHTHLQDSHINDDCIPKLSSYL